MNILLSRLTLAAWVSVRAQPGSQQRIIHSHIHPSLQLQGTPWRHFYHDTSRTHACLWFVEDQEAFQHFPWKVYNVHNLHLSPTYSNIRHLPRNSDQACQTSPKKIL